MFDSLPLDIRTPLSRLSQLGKNAGTKALHLFWLTISL